jgi:SAM-dependent methyltransferase
MKATHNPDVFEKPDLEGARRIILTPAQEADTDTRWAKETPYLVELVTKQLGDLSGRLILDYGCGIGRVAKALIEATGCSVLGVDSSPRMRALALEYAPTAAFSVVSRRLLQGMVWRGLRVDAAISVWVLQHCPSPQEDLELITSSLRPGGRLFVVNNHERALPTKEAGWMTDGLDIRAMLKDRLSEIATGVLDTDATSEYISRNSFWATYQVR